MKRTSKLKGDSAISLELRKRRSLLSRSLLSRPWRDGRCDDASVPPAANEEHSAAEQPAELGTEATWRLGLGSNGSTIVSWAPSVRNTARSSPPVRRACSSGELGLRAGRAAAPPSFHAR